MIKFGTICIVIRAVTPEAIGRLVTVVGPLRDYLFTDWTRCVAQQVDFVGPPPLGYPFWAFPPSWLLPVGGPPVTSGTRIDADIGLEEARV